MLHPWVAKATVTKAHRNQGERRHCLSPARLHGGGRHGYPPTMGTWCRSAAGGRPRRLASRRGASRRAEGPTPAWRASIAGRFSPWGIPRAIRGSSTAHRLQRHYCPLGNNSSSISIQTAGGPVAGRSRADRTSFTRERARGSFGARASGSAAAGEPTTEEKVARLVQYAAARGSLDGGPAAPDVRRMPQVGAAK